MLYIEIVSNTDDYSNIIPTYFSQYLRVKPFR